MSEMLCCSRCRAETPASRLFCQGCGLGLQLLSAPSGALLDAPVGPLYGSALLGGLLGFLLSVPLFWGLLEISGQMLSPETAAPWLTLFLWRIVPLLFAAGASVFLVRRARALGLEASLWKAFGGASWLLGLGFLLAPLAGEAPLAIACLFCPLSAARFGLGLFAPWTPWSRLALWTVVLVAFFVLLGILSPS